MNRWLWLGLCLLTIVVLVHVQTIGATPHDYDGVYRSDPITPETFDTVSLSGYHPIEHHGMENDSSPSITTTGETGGTRSGLWSRLKNWIRKIYQFR